jgi:predicted PurR-regulated permease PerM
MENPELAEPVGPNLHLKWVAWAASVTGLLLVLQLHLVPALMAGLLVHELVRAMAPRLGPASALPRHAKLAVVLALAVLVVLSLIGAGFGLLTFLRSDAGNLTNLMHRAAEIIEGARGKLPPWVAAGLPENADQLSHLVVEWLRSHVADLQLLGKGVGMAFVHVMVGMVLGALVSLHEVDSDAPAGPLAQALAQQAHRLSEAFARVVFAQVRISALNTLFTGVYLAVVLPAFGVQLPLVKTLIALTFVLGLIPVLGNLMSNVVIVVVSLNHSLGAALGSLSYLVLIHKLEYFMNARIVGAQIRCAAWELLLALLVMEAAFGIPGVIAAPVFYAFVKGELKREGWV